MSPSGSAAASVKQSEDMSADPSLKSGMIVDYPARRGAKAGSCIFMQVWSGDAVGTDARVGMPNDRMTVLQKWSAQGFTAIAILTLQLPANDPFQYRAGQFVEFILRDGSRRSYSMATAPQATGDKPQIELHLRHLPGGKFTDHVFGAMKEKEILRVEGPFGSFFLREDSDKPLILLASGTGFAGVRSV